MKKHLNILLLFFSTIAFGQFVEHKSPNDDWYANFNTKISYSNGKEDLKEILTLQSLLAENRIDEMMKMMKKFGYVFIPNTENLLWKSKIGDNEISPIIQLENLGNNDVFYENHLNVWFSFNRKLKLIEKQKAIDIHSLVDNLFPIGNNYKYLKNTWNESLALPEGTSMEWLDRYTVKVINANKTSIYKASNFHYIPPTFKERKGFTTIIFSGPGKSFQTKILFKKNIENTINTSEYYVPYISLLSYVSNPVDRALGLKSDFKPESRKPFNIDFFMSLEEFNDRIWLDD